MTNQKTNFEEVMQERFARLPQSVQNAITSADVEEHLRELSKTHQLHLDQWNLLENEVMLTLLGLQQTAQLKENIVKEVGVSDEVATALADDIAQYVFQPIRDELERQLDNPAAQAAQVSDVDAVRAQILSDGGTSTPAGETAVQPATPPAPPPVEKAAHVDTSTTYLSQTPSHERKTIEGDPYREQVD